jgi:hypothetical protein
VDASLFLAKLMNARSFLGETATTRARRLFRVRPVFKQETQQVCIDY